jgi:hypothetical protein
MGSEQPDPAQFPTGSFPVQPCAADAALLAILSSSRYDDLNMAVHQGVRGLYRAQMLPACQQLLENERILKCIVNEKEAPGAGSARAKHDTPEEMTNVELFQAISALRAKIEEQRNVNESGRSDVEILIHARDRYEFEFAFQMLDLKRKEITAYDDGFDDPSGPL